MVLFKQAFASGGFVMKSFIRESICSIEFKELCLTDSNQIAALKEQNFNFDIKYNYIFKSHSASVSEIFKLIMGLSESKPEQYLLNSLDVANLSFDEFLKYRMNMGYSFDFGGLLSNRTLRDNILLPLQYHNLDIGQSYESRVDELIDIMDLQAYANERPFHVPGFARKITCFLRAMVHKPQILVLDAPCSALDKVRVKMFWYLMQEEFSKGNFKSCIMQCEEEQFLTNMKFESLFIHEYKIHQEQDLKKVSI